jgi:hypothetical protein
MVDKVALGQFFSKYLGFLLSAITSPVLHSSIIQGYTMGSIDATAIVRDIV